VSEVKILRVEKSGKKYLVYTSEDDSPFKIYEDDIVNYRIIKGTVFDEEAWKKITKSFNDSKLFDRVLHYIDYKLRTEKEVVLYLKSLDATDDQIKEIIKKCKKINYLDDDRYASIYVEESIKNKVGPKLIRYNLENLGIERALIDKYLGKISDDVFLDNAKELATKYLKTLAKYPEKKQLDKLKDKLLRMGYNTTTTLNAISTQNIESCDSEIIIRDYEKLLTKTTDKNKIITSLLAKGYKYEDIKKVLKN